VHQFGERRQRFQPRLEAGPLILHDGRLYSAEEYSYILRLEAERAREYSPRAICAAIEAERLERDRQRAEARAARRLSNATRKGPYKPPR
jgi:hypothetical protein